MDCVEGGVVVAVVEGADGALIVGQEDKCQRTDAYDVKHANSTPKRVFLRFNASVEAPDCAGIFMEQGGKIESVSVLWQTDFSLTGSTNSVNISCPYKGTCSVEVDLPNGYVVNDDDEIELPSDTRLNASTQCMATAINGTLATSLSGEGSDYLYYAALSKSHYQIGMRYKTYLAHSSTLAISNLLVLSTDEHGNEKRHRLRFVKPTDEDVGVVKAGAKIAEMYAKQGYNMRDLVVYKPAPALHKTVYSELVGINNLGYNFLHAILDRESFLTLEALNDLLKSAVWCECDKDMQTFQQFKSSCDRPGMAAAAYARTMANAICLVVNVLMSYRADGRSVVLPNAVGFVAVENWNASVPRSCMETNDCDGLALLAIALMRTAVNMDAGDSAKYEFLRYVKNVIFPHYQMALCIVGATAAEATSADANHSSIAGHAIVVLLPTMSFLRALAKSSGKVVGEEGHCVNQAEEESIAIQNMRFEAFFPYEATKDLPTHELDLLSDWEIARHEFHHLEALSIEGTTPAISTMYQSNPEKRRQAIKLAEKDKRVFVRAAPNVFRSVKRLHVGSVSETSTHTFYSSLVELTFAPDSPLWTYEPLRAHGAAATQYVLYSNPDADNITSAGVSPSDVVMQNYGALPLVSVSASVAQVVDFACSKARRDVMPPRVPSATKLSEFQTKSLQCSLAHIDHLKTFLEAGSAECHANALIEDDKYHTVAYVCAFNTLVHNPVGVKQFVDVIKTFAKGGSVYKETIKGLAQNSEGDADVGVFLYIEVRAETE